jgi:transglutaminase-like putative cysteine protease
MLAAAPAAALVAFAGVVLDDGPRPGYAVLFLLGVLALLFADGLRRVRQWGPVRPWSSGLADVHRRSVSSSTTRGARRVAVMVVGVALLIPGILPGLHSKPVLDLGANDNSIINPLVSVSAALKLHNPVPLFSVHVPRQDGLYWRWLALDQFDGDQWTTGDIDAAKGRKYGSTASLPFQVPTLPRGTDVRVVSATVTVAHSPGATGWLALPYEPFQLSTPGTDIRFDASHTDAVADQPLLPGFTYRVDSRVLLPSYAQLDHTFDYSGHQYQRDLQLPGDLPPQITQLARAIVKRADAHTPLEEALAVQQYLTDPTVFSYDATVPSGAGDDALQDFLFTTHRGFCQQFASSMAVLMRALGVPARVAVGFTPGVYNSGAGAYEVTTQNAHTWVEVEFPGFGWVPFEPTPTRANPVTDNIVQTKPVKADLPPGCDQEHAVRGGCRDTGGTTGGGGTGSNGSKNPRTGDPFIHGDGTSGGTGGTTGRKGPIILPDQPPPPGQPMSWRLLLAIVAIAVVVLVLVLFPIVKIGVRRLRVIRAKGSRERTLAEFRLFEARAGDVGLARGPGETPWEYRSRLAQEVRFSDGHLDRLANVAGTAAYSTHEIGESDAEGAGRDGRVAIRDVRRSAGVARRFTGLWRPQI